MQINPTGGGAPIQPPDFSASSSLGASAAPMENVNVTCVWSLFSDGGAPTKSINGDNYLQVLLAKVAGSWGENTPGPNGLSGRLTQVDKVINSLKGALSGLSSMLEAYSALHIAALEYGENSEGFKSVSEEYWGKQNQQNGEAFYNLLNNQPKDPFGAPQGFVDMSYFLESVISKLQGITDETPVSFLETFTKWMGSYNYKNMYDVLSALYDGQVMPTWHS